jgi:hypothetical protein
MSPAGLGYTFHFSGLLYTVDDVCANKSNNNNNNNNNNNAQYWELNSI